MSKRLNVIPHQVSIASILDDVYPTYESKTKIEIPDFQRKAGQWTLAKKRVLITTILEGICPITQPILLGTVLDKPTTILIDGLQRISTIYEFRNGEFSISLNGEDDVKFGGLDKDDQRALLNYPLTQLTVLNIPTQEMAAEYFKQVNEGVPLSPFQKTKGFGNVAKFCKLVEADVNIHNLLIALGIYKNSQSLIENNIDNSVDILLVSIIALTKSPIKFKQTSAYASQWVFHQKDLEQFLVPFLETKYWRKLYGQFSKMFLNVKEYLPRKESKLMLLYVLLYIKPEKLPNINKELIEFIKSGGFSYNTLITDGKPNASGSRTKLFNTVNSFLEHIEKASKRTFSLETKAKVLALQKGKCYYCAAPLDISVTFADHKIPYSKGGKTIYENCVASCQKCNLIKSNKEV